LWGPAYRALSSHAKNAVGHLCVCRLLVGGGRLPERRCSHNHGVCACVRAYVPDFVGYIPFVLTTCARIQQVRCCGQRLSRPAARRLSSARCCCRLLQVNDVLRQALLLQTPPPPLLRTLSREKHPSALISCMPLSHKFCAMCDAAADPARCAMVVRAHEQRCGQCLEKRAAGSHPSGQ
jgi:hypothetical protein